MQLPDLKHDFYAAFVDEVRIGPRRELSLSMGIWQRSSVQGDSRFVNIRFGGIVNFDEVQAFFADFHNSVNAHEGLHWLRYDNIEKSKPGSLFIRMQFDRTGDEVLIHCRNVTVSD